MRWLLVVALLTLAVGCDMQPRKKKGSDKPAIDYAKIAEAKDAFKDFLRKADEAADELAKLRDPDKIKQLSGTVQSDLRKAVDVYPEYAAVDSLNQYGRSIAKFFNGCFETVEFQVRKKVPPAQFPDGAVKAIESNVRALRETLANMKKEVDAIDPEKPAKKK